LQRSAPGFSSAGPSQRPPVASTPHAGTPSREAGGTGTREPSAGLPTSAVPHTGSFLKGKRPVRACQAAGCGGAETRPERANGAEGDPRAEASRLVGQMAGRSLAWAVDATRWARRFIPSDLGDTRANPQRRLRVGELTWERAGATQVSDWPRLCDGREVGGGHDEVACSRRPAPFL